jgi:heme/copper-type cytochrome/quinol oxidase subunit 3
MHNILANSKYSKELATKLGGGGGALVSNSSKITVLLNINFVTVQVCEYFDSTILLNITFVTVQVCKYFNVYDMYSKS